MAKNAVQRLSALSIVKAGRVEFMVLRGGVGMASARGASAQFVLPLAAFALVIAAWIVWGPGAGHFETFSVWSISKINSLGDWYQKTVEGPAKLIAPLVTLMTGSLVILQWIWYSDKKLFDRLHDFLQREEKRLQDARNQLRLSIERPGPARQFEQPVFLAESLARATRELGWGSYFLPPQVGYAEGQLDSAIAQLSTQNTLSVERGEHLSSQLGTAHVLRGALLVAEGEKNKRTKIDGRGQYVAALKHFHRAMELNRKDTDALEYASHVYVTLGQPEEADKLLNRILKITEKDAKSLQRARALRYKSLIVASGAQPRPGVAKRHLKEALRVLPNLQGIDWIEEAELHEMLGDRQSSSKFHRRARAEYGISRAIFALINTDEARAGAERIDCKLPAVSAPTPQDSVDDDDDEDDTPQPPVHLN